MDQSAPSDVSDVGPAAAGTEACRDMAPVSRRLGVATLYVLLGNVFTLLVGFPLQIYVTRVLGAEGVGTFGLLEAAAASAAGFLGFGIAPTAMRFLPAHLERAEYGEARGLVRIGGPLLAAIGFAAYVVLLLLLPVSDSVWPAFTPYRMEAAIMGLFVPLGLCIHFLQQSLRGLQEVRQVILGSSVLQLTLKALLVLAAFALGLRLTGYILAAVCSIFIATLWLLFVLWARLRALPKAAPTSTSYPQWSHYALISYFGALLGAATSGLDRFLVGSMFGTGAVGVLMVARTLQGLPEQFNRMLLMVGAPLLSAAHARGAHAERAHIFHLMTDWSVRLSMPLVLFLLIFAHPVLSLYGQTFADRGGPALQIVVGAQFFSLLCGPVGSAALMSGLERASFYVLAVGSALVVVLYCVLIPQLAVVGAAITIAAGVVFANVTTVWLVKRRIGLHWWDKRYIAWLPQAAGSLLLAYAGLHLPVSFGAVGLIVMLTAMYAISAAINLLTGLHQDDRDFLRIFVARFFR
ncbi:MAG TPA: oligosaccharide flippase family protein [Pseudolabrys sp.]|uniref:oligosaccharide flippase family protein n=1 Tax=Pseudolabrys sp. TaxID=1960880 RepID=UPI002DDCC0F2|nr:oligosaccharide flippase family protein [Pseudolabrys sp.]HEV2630183.1 oligosaccharide flippase family protein [Pseudolabrys sp.]